MRNPAAWCAIAVVALAPLIPADLRAQDAEADVRAVVDRMFDAMQAKDTTAFRAALLPGFRVVITAFDDAGGPVIRPIDADAFITSIGRSTSELEERIENVEIRVLDNLATVWNDYAFYVDGVLDHCGVDAFTLVRTDDGWKVAHVADTQRREGCRDIPG
jgi:hypothetical protein